MDKKTIITMKQTFDDIMHTTDDGSVEFWYARELMECLGYATWRRFKESVERAKESCEGAGIEVSDHFAGVGKMIDLPKGARREVDNIMLSKYELCKVGDEVDFVFVPHRMHFFDCETEESIVL